VDRVVLIKASGVCVVSPFVLSAIAEMDMSLRMPLQGLHQKLIYDVGRYHYWYLSDGLDLYYYYPAHTAF